MTPEDIATHPSISAVRVRHFDFGKETKAVVPCGRCDVAVELPPGTYVRRPCDQPRCEFSVVFPARPAGNPDAFPDEPVVAGGRVNAFGNVWWSVVGLPRQRLLPPSPPQSAEEYADRVDAVIAMVPSMRGHIPHAPIGWFGLLEIAAHALDARGLGEALRTVQVKEKMGTLRWYGSGPPDAIAITDWAEAMTHLTCARDGTLDGRLVSVRGWLITLGSAARADQERLGSDAVTLYPRWAR